MLPRAMFMALDVTQAPTSQARDSPARCKIARENWLLRKAFRALGRIFRVAEIIVLSLDYQEEKMELPIVCCITTTNEHLPNTNTSSKRTWLIFGQSPLFVTDNFLYVTSRVRTPLFIGNPAHFSSKSQNRYTFFGGHQSQ